ncbi:MAG TPA: patatin-like phospholipase family protein [Longimicrobium sp.]|nr:patatin-like phospholipase family protein [Longimicrobium sp.]
MPQETMPGSPCDEDAPGDKVRRTFECARNVLNGLDLPPKRALKLVKQLRTWLGYQYAREISWRYMQRAGVTPDDRFEFMRVLVTSTYKDLALPPETSLPRSLRILTDAGFDADRLTWPGAPAQKAEVLGLAGAIHKRLWEHDGDVRHLEESLRCYKAGYGADVALGYGYPAINAAYLLDLLASLDQSAPHPDPSTLRGVQARRVEAAVIRTQLTILLPPLRDVPGKEGLATDWWYHATVAEAYLGLKQYAQTVTWLKEGLLIGNPKAPAEALRNPALRPADWEYESTTHQLAALARVQSRLDGVAFNEDAPAWAAVREAFGDEFVAGVHSSFVGKIGIALSGGGFRASLYHIGVLARLAELDLLRHVEVISCVSGGSILGAHYYLEVRQLLSKTPDPLITRKHYIEIVERLAKHFLAGVQTNLRNRLFAEAGTALRDTVSRRAVRTERLGELFEEALYSQVEDGEQNSPRWLNKLPIDPARYDDDRRDDMPAFIPRLQNWRRHAKVPILVLNATTLNTGHTWQFTTTWMGEPPGGSDPRVDSTPRLRRLRYEDAPVAYRDFRLGHAVAASACVPGLFAPLVLPGLYPGLTVRLVDGGVHDNQGAATLLEQGCTVLLVSDASGQLDLLDEPGGGKLSVPMRANNVLMARVREVQFKVLEARRRAQVLRGLLYVHLKSDLVSDPVDPAGSPEPWKVWTFDRVPPPGGELLTSYGMRRDVQERLAGIRTDLDAFSDLEAFALMESGYQATRDEFGAAVPAFSPPQPVPQVAWTFHRAMPYVASVGVKTPEEYQAVCAHLAEGSQLFWKGRPMIARAGKVYSLLFPRRGVAKKGMGARLLALGSTLLAPPMLLLRPLGNRAWLGRGKVP